MEKRVHVIEQLEDMLDVPADRLDDLFEAVKRWHESFGALRAAIKQAVGEDADVHGVFVFKVDDTVTEEEVVQAVMERKARGKTVEGTKH